MATRIHTFLLGIMAGFSAVLLAGGCATATPAKRMPTPPILQAEKEIPEEQLLDVGIVPLDPGNIPQKSLDENVTSDKIREAESQFIACHLKETLQASGHWGAVRVIPENMESSDLVIRGRIFNSTGERLHVGFVAVDATGRVWMEREYNVGLDGNDYLEAGKNHEEPFQTIYTRFANDLATFKMSLTPEQIATLRRTAQMRFAAEFAPSAFGSYVDQKEGRYRVVRMPAENDPMMERLQRVRDRESMFVDTLDEYYMGFYEGMKPDYESWRRFSQTEFEALQQLKQKSIGRIAGGLALIAAAIALEMAGVDNTSSLRDVLILAGGAVVIDGINVSQQSAIHRAGIEELSQSFSADMETVIVEFEGKKVELTGSAQEQYQQWRELLHKIYEEETGFADERPKAAPPGRG